MRREHEMIAGRYEVKRVLGGGGEGMVYLASDLLRGETVAVKETRLDGKSREEAVEEASRLAKLHCSGLPRLLSIFGEKDTLYVVMEYVPGKSLRALQGENGCLPEETVRQVALQLCEILTYLHTRKPAICFRDLKPSNILLGEDGSVHLIDFGSTGSLTRGYAAPEQYLPERTLDARTDLYALGVTMHYLLTGKNPNQPPFQFEQARKLNPKVTNQMSEIVEKLLQPQPEDRYENAEALRTALSEKKRFALPFSLPKRLETLKFAGVPKKRTLVLGVLAAAVFFAALIGRTSEALGHGAIRFSLKPGTYEAYQLLTIDYDESAGRLVYTVDGSEPTRDSPVYRDGIVISRPEMTVRAKLLAFDGEDRDAEATYHISAPVEEIAVSMEREAVWEIYYALGKKWTEPLYNYELAEIRALPGTLTGEDAWLKDYMPYYSLPRS